MGQLEDYELIDWSELKKFSRQIRQLGIQQLVQILKVKGRADRSYPLLWGEEIEYIIVNLDHQNFSVNPSLRVYQLLPQLQADEILNLITDSVHFSLFRPEFSSFALEGIPGKPYSSSIEALLEVEKGMVNRRKRVESCLNANEALLTMSTYPNLKTDIVSDQDSFITPLPRYMMLSRNLLKRINREVNVNLPVFEDKNTVATNLNFNCLPHATSSCCLQTTFQLKNCDEARFVYDRLVPIAPLMLSLTACSPIFKGYLADVDCRWDLFTKSLDDRTDEELDFKSTTFINKSRGGPSPVYIANHKSFKQDYNDVPISFDKYSYRNLKLNGIDDLLAKHFAYIFLNDPLMRTKPKMNGSNLQLESDGCFGNLHFENLQTSCWQSVRFKPPSARNNTSTANSVDEDAIGWRVELRTMEVQLTEFENAAFSIFTNLLVRTILHFQLNLYVPMSKVDSNFDKATERDSINRHKFYFRNDISSGSKDAYRLMSIDTIFNGSFRFVGLIPLIYKYLQQTKVAKPTVNQLIKYLDLVKDRASCKSETNATFMRKFVLHHPSYQQDSKVPDKVIYDLINTIDGIKRTNQLEMKPKLLDSKYNKRSAQEKVGSNKLKFKGKAWDVLKNLLLF